MTLGPEVIESALKLADLHEPGGGLDEDWATTVARSSPAFERRRAHGNRESVGIIRAQRVAELSEQEGLSAKHGCEGAEFDGHVAPFVVDRIAAIVARSVRPIAGRDQHRPGRRDNSGDRDRLNGRDRLSERDDGNVVFSEKSGAREIRVSDETGDARTGTGNGRERYRNAFIRSEAMCRRQYRARID